MREEIFARQKRLGVIPAGTQLTPRPAKLPAWDSLPPDRKRIAARLMETYAGFLAHTDDQIGRLVTALEQMGEFENTLFFYIVGDNGASGEGGLMGTVYEWSIVQGYEESPEDAAPKMVGRSHRIDAEAELPAEGGEGVVAAEGGTSGGWCLYINSEGRPVYTYSLFGLKMMSITGKERLSAGPSTISMDFAYDAGGWGRGAQVRLLVNDKLVGELRLPRTTPVLFSIDENFDIGTDSGSPVGDYPANYSFTGVIKKVSVSLK